MRQYFLGLDLGQPNDYSALALVEWTGEDYHCRGLQRWPMRTPYPAIVSDVTKVLKQPEIKARAQGSEPLLVIDATGVGAPVVDLFRAEYKQGKKWSRGIWVIDLDDDTPTPPGLVRLQVVQLTNGDTVTSDDEGVKHVPKLDLVGSAQVALQTERLKIAEGLAEAQTLIREMLNFQVKVRLGAAPDNSIAWREGEHDGLVLAVALALWAANNETPQLPRVGLMQGKVTVRQREGY
jgi:hypothetical protein